MIHESPDLHLLIAQATFFNVIFSPLLVMLPPKQVNAAILIVMLLNVGILLILVFHSSLLNWLQTKWYQDGKELVLLQW